MSQTTNKIAWFHCFAGIAGDMALGSLIDAGADPVELRSMLDRLPISGWSLDLESVLRGGLSATRALVSVQEDGISRTFLHIVKIIEEAKLPDRVRARALGAFTALAEVEGSIHHRPATQVHFHELGGHDTIIDIVGTAIALELLEVDVVCASPVATGRGMVRSQHGMIPNPSPAVVALLKDAPVYGREVDVELTTPTGAAILSTMGTGFGPLPAMTISACGYGAGGRDIDGFPNCTQVVLGTSVLPTESAPSGQVQVLLEANLDDATGEQLSDVMTALFASGAADAWITPVVMKKGRPGHVISVLCDVALEDQLRKVLMRESGSLGVRSSHVDRFAARRSSASVELDGQTLRIKVSPGRAKVEHDDAAAAAQLLGLPVREVVSRAEAAWRDHLAHREDE
jgi:hypothetical protein